MFLQLVLWMAIVCNLIGLVLSANILAMVKRRGYESVKKEFAEKLTGWIEQIIVLSIPFFNVLFVFIVLLSNDNLMLKTLIDGNNIIKIKEEE